MKFSRAMDMKNCARRWRLNATCVRDTVTRPACRRARLAQPSVSSRSSFLVQLKRFYDAARIKRMRPMALAGKSPTQPPTIRRIWRTPGSKLNWLFLLASLVIYGSVFLIDRNALATQFADPATDPFRDFGIVAFVLVLVVTAYTLRRRFARGLPGKVQSWLWVHTWFGVISILIVFMHEGYQNITHDFSFLADRFTEADYGTTAMYALLLLVLTGVVGRLLDMWQARVIAAEADTNGVGITRSIEERMHELSLTIGRLRAGKSAPFQQF